MSNERPKTAGARPERLVVVLLMLFVFTGLTLTANAQSLDDFKAAIAQYEKMSPAGGPSKNPKAAVLVLFRKSEKIGWVVDGKLVAADVVSPREKDDTKEGGLTPVGEFLIGKNYKHPDHKIDWHKLYPRMEDNTGYYGYTAKTKTGRFAMGLHPGSISLGCVTIKSSKQPYDA